MLANQLARRGARAVIIDRHSGPAQQSRAIAVQARTLEIYSKMGIIDKALELGIPATGANMWANGKWTARIPLGDIGKSLSTFPFVLQLSQDDNERIMGAKLRDCGIDVQWNTELIAFEQHPDCVDATIKQPDGSTRKINRMGRADGARAVREVNYRMGSGWQSRTLPLRRERSELVLARLDDADVGLGHLVPGACEVAERL